MNLEGDFLAMGLKNMFYILPYLILEIQRNTKKSKDLYRSIAISILIA